jgi:RNA polymerase sigma-70 factor (ECF subfamily)
VRFAEAFLRGLPEAGRSGFDDQDALELILARASAAARASWPGVDLDDARFAAGVAARASGGMGELATLHCEDLYLACALVAADPEALGVFERDLLRPVVRRLASPAENIDELTQIFMLRLVVERGEDGTCRVERYSGRGSLAAWVRVAVLRRLHTLRAKSMRREDRLHLALGVLVESGVPELELGRAHERFGHEFGAAFEEAVEALSPLERRMLRQHHLQRLTLEQLGDLYGIHRVTVARQLARARRRLLETTSGVLRDRLGIESDELREALRSILGRVEVSLERLLASQADR